MCCGPQGGRLKSSKIRKTFACVNDVIAHTLAVHSVHSGHHNADGMAGRLRRRSEFLPIYPFSHELRCSSPDHVLLCLRIQPDTVHQHIELKRGARRIVFLFIMTIATAVASRRDSLPSRDGHDDGARLSAVLWILLA